MRRKGMTVPVDARVVAGELHAWLLENPGQGARAIEERYGINDNQLVRVLLAGEEAGTLFYEEFVPQPSGRNGGRLAYFAFDARQLAEVG